MSSATRSILFLSAIAAVAAAQQAERTLVEPTTLKEAWTAGLRRMREANAPGLVFVLPPENANASDAALAAVKRWTDSRQDVLHPASELKTARDAMLALVQSWRWPRFDLDPVTWITADRPDFSVLFALAVPIVAERETCGARADDTLMLLAPEGSVLGRWAVDLGDDAAVAAVLEPQLLSSARIAVRRDAVPAALAQQAKEFCEQVAKPTYVLEPSPKLQRTLRAALHVAAPALVEFRDVPGAGGAGEPAPPRQMHSTEALLLLTEGTPPLGTAVAEQWDPCPFCGMSSFRLPVCSLLKLLPK
jgi:hypothetical protein